MEKIAKGVDKINFAMLYGNYCYIFIENFPRAFSPYIFRNLGLSYDWTSGPYMKFFDVTPVRAVSSSCRC